MDAEMLRAIALVLGGVGGVIAACASLYNIHMTHEQNAKLDDHGVQLDAMVTQNNGMRKDLENVARAQGVQQGRDDLTREQAETES